jgi:hypothetical protein
MVTPDTAPKTTSANISTQGEDVMSRTNAVATSFVAI